MQTALVILLFALLALLYVIWGAFRKLRESEVYFRSLFENALELITVIDAQGGIVYENPSNERFVGYRRKEMLGKNIFEFIHPEDLPRVQAAFAEALKRPGAVPSIRFRLKPKDGGWKWIEAFGNNLLADPAIRGVVVNSRDITRQVEDDARIRELNELRNRFIQVVSHQLRTPLSGIRWTLEALLDEAYGKVKKEQAEPMRASLDSSVEIIRRINDMLTAIEVEEGKAVLDKTNATLEDAWQRTLAAWKRRCAESGLTCSYTAPSVATSRAEFDLEKIADVMAKMADNAVRYTPRGGHLAAKIGSEDGRVRFEIMDDGIGVPKEDQGRIFTRFFRASNATDMLPDADGISLSIAKHFVEAHGGRIGFSSGHDKGCTFWFELPA